MPDEPLSLATPDRFIDRRDQVEPQADVHRADVQLFPAGRREEGRFRSARAAIADVYARSGRHRRRAIDARVVCRCGTADDAPNGCRGLDGWRDDRCCRDSHRPAATGNGAAAGCRRTAAGAGIRWSSAYFSGLTETLINPSNGPSISMIRKTSAQALVDERRIDSATACPSCFVAWNDTARELGNFGFGSNCNGRRSGGRVKSERAGAAAA